MNRRVKMDLIAVPFRQPAGGVLFKIYDKDGRFLCKVFSRSGTLQEAGDFLRVHYMDDCLTLEGVMGI